MGSHNGIRLSKGGIHLILCLALLRVFKTAINVGPVPHILYYGSDLGWSCLSRFVGALRWGQGTFVILVALWGLTKVVAG
jgi:hypothetical protein